MHYHPPEEPFCLLLGNGDYPDESIVKNIGAAADLIISCDGGANYAKRHDILPRIIIGDQDSISAVTTRYFTDLHVDILRRKSQQENDLEKALDYLFANHGYKVVVLIGFLGARDDHSYATMQIAEKYCHKRIFYLYSKTAEYIALPAGNHTLNLSPNQIISIFPFPEASNVTSIGLKWNLNFASFPRGSQGVSNIVENKAVTIAFHSGNLLLILPN